jgi:hypothetical protein
MSEWQCKSSTDLIYFHSKKTKLYPSIFSTFSSPDLGFQFSGESELNESEQCVTNELQHSDASSPGAVKQDSLSLSSSYEPADSNATAPILQATQQINPIDESFVTASVDEHMVKGSDVEPDMSSEDLLQAMAEGTLLCNIMFKSDCHTVNPDFKERH